MIELPSDCGVVLDLDDTLYSEWSYQYSGFRAVAEYATADSWLSVYREMLATCRAGGNALQLVSQRSRVSVDELLEVHRNHVPRIELYPDADRLLSRLSRSGHRVAILTDGRPRTQRNKIAALGIEDRVQHVLISDEMGFGKPDTRAYLEAAVRLSGESFVYIGDNPAKDFLAPKALGWLTVMLVERGNNVHPQHLEVGEEKRAAQCVISLDEFELTF